MHFALSDGARQSGSSLVFLCVSIMSSERHPQADRFTSTILNLCDSAEEICGCLENAAKAAAVVLQHASQLKLRLTVQNTPQDGSNTSSAEFMVQQLIVEREQLCAELAARDEENAQLRESMEGSYVCAFCDNSGMLCVVAALKETMKIVVAAHEEATATLREEHAKAIAELQRQLRSEQVCTLGPHDCAARCV